MAIGTAGRQPSTKQRAGARAEHKQRTRTAIRQAAMKLFAAQGYAKTTVEQIAEEAQVSHTTFFRYFGSKELVVISDDLHDEVIEAFESIEPGLSHFDLVRRMVSTMYTTAANDPWASDPARMALIRSEPALHTRYSLEADQSISDAAQMISDYTGVGVDDLRLKTFIWAVAGVLFHISEDTADPMEPGTLDTLMAAIDLLEAGLPLR